MVVVFTITKMNYLMIPYFAIWRRGDGLVYRNKRKAE